MVGCTVCTVFHCIGVFDSYTVSQQLYFMTVIFGGYFYVVSYLHTVENLTVKFVRDL